MAKKHLSFSRSRRHINAMSKEKPSPQSRKGQKKAEKPEQPGETGGPEGPEPTRYGDWERGGKCVDF